MLIIPPPKYRNNRRLPDDAASVPTPPAAALELVSAAYDPTALTLTLVFDRAFDVSGFDGSQVTVTDGYYRESIFSGADSPTMLDPSSVSIGLNFGDACGPGDVTLDATALTGIVADDDGGTWAGASDLVLPFG